jgi:hypothetical protein
MEIKLAKGTLRVAGNVELVGQGRVLDCAVVHAGQRVVGTGDRVIAVDLERRF